MTVEERYDWEFCAEVGFSRKDGTFFKLEKGFNTLEEAKTWIKEKAFGPSMEWWEIESLGETILKGE